MADKKKEIKIKDTCIKGKSIEENIDLNNPELQQALQIIQFTHRSLFLTGKAGTGKSRLK